MIKINTSGDYVQLIYVDPVQESVQQELKSDTDAFECSYDSEGKLYMQFGLMRFENPDPTDFTINGSAVTDAADFITKLTALFTGGGGGGSSLLPTMGAGTATGDITGDVNGHVVLFKSGAIPALSINDEGYVGVGIPTSGYLWAVVNPNTNDVLEKVDIDTKESFLKMMDNAMGGQMESGFHAFASNAGGEGDVANFNASATFNNGVDPITTITISGNAQTQALVYTALTHTFSGAVGITDLGGNGAGFAAVGNDGVISWAAGDPAGTIYAADGALSNDRTVDLNGNDISFNDTGVANLFTLSRQSGNEYALLAAKDGIGTVQLFLETNDEGGYFFSLSATKDQDVSIRGQGTDGALIYTALTHTLNGAMITPDVLSLDFADDAAAAIGGVAVSQWYHNAGALRIRRS